MNTERVFRWYDIAENVLPNDGEQIHFDDLKRTMHLGRFLKKDQWDREDIFVTTEGSYFMKDEVFAWMPIQKQMNPEVNLFKLELPSGITVRIIENKLSPEYTAIVSPEVYKMVLKGVESICNKEPNAQVSDTTGFEESSQR